MACDYCKPKRDGIVYCMNYPEYSGIEITMSHTGELCVRYYEDEYAHFLKAQDSININFCPMCGRDLREGR